MGTPSPNSKDAAVWRRSWNLTALESPARRSTGFQYEMCRVARWMLQSFTGDGNIQTSPAYRSICLLTASRAVLDSLTVRRPALVLGADTRPLWTDLDIRSVQRPSPHPSVVEPTVPLASRLW